MWSAGEAPAGAAVDGDDGARVRQEEARRVHAEHQNLPAISEIYYSNSRNLLHQFTKFTTAIQENLQQQRFTVTSLILHFCGCFHWQETTDNRARVREKGARVHAHHQNLPPTAPTPFNENYFIDA